MTGSIDKFLIKVEKKLTELSKVSDLVACGYFTSQQLARLRTNKKGPSFLKLGGRILYPKECVLEYIKNHSYVTNTGKFLCKLPDLV